MCFRRAADSKGRRVEEIGGPRRPRRTVRAVGAALRQRVWLWLAVPVARAFWYSSTSFFSWSGGISS